MNKRGVALILSYLVIVVLSILGAAFVSRSMSESNITRRSVYSTRAFWLAEGGIQRTIWELNYGGGTWTGWGGSGDTRTLAATISGYGDYNVTVNGLSGNNPQIDTIGYYPSRDSASQLTRAIRVETEKSSLFLFAAFAQQSLSMTGSAYTDSYDSGDGRYNQSGNQGSNGDIGTNGTTTGVISLVGNASVYGDASTGPGGTISMNPNTSISGDKEYENNLNLPSVTVDSSLTGLPSSGSINLSGRDQEVSLNGGNYKYSSISISGRDARLNISGNVQIYLTGDLSITGQGGITVSNGAQLMIYTDGNANISGNGIATQSYLPSSFILYGTGSPASRSIQISGNGDFYGAVYAPDASISTGGNGEVYGSLVGKIVDIGNGGLHYDEALTEIGGPSLYTLESWKEMY